MVVVKSSSIFNSMVFFLCTIQLVCAQDSTRFESSLDKVYVNVEEFYPEKVYLQTDKDYYVNGDTLWFKAHIVDGVSHKMSEKSRVVYVELVDSNQQVVERRSIYIGFDGGAGDIIIKDDFLEGVYFLRAYTKYMLNEKEPVFFQKEIPIWTYAPVSKKNSKKNSRKKRRKEVSKDRINEMVSAKPVFQFFPEGGNLVAGLNNVLGLKVTDIRGVGVALTGKIINNKGSLITMFGTYQFGLGKVQFQVEKGVDYFAEIEIHGKVEKYKLPRALDKGYVLQVNNRGEFIQIKVNTNIENGLSGSLVLGHIRGATVLKYLAENKTHNTYEIKLSTADLNDGVATFTFFTPDGDPVCERLVFIENQINAVRLSVKTDTQDFSSRNKVSVQLDLIDEIGLPVNGDFSMTVTSQKAINEQAESLKSWLLLNSDLGGLIENPSYFFQEDLKGRKNLLDILMLTHGWRRFVWSEIGSKKANTELLFQPEKGLLINGHTVNLYNRQETLVSSVDLTISEPSVYKEKTLTTSKGEFSFGPMIFRDSIRAVIAASDDANDQKDVAIYLESSLPKLLISDSIRLQKHRYGKEIKQSFLNEVSRSKINDFENNSRVIKLDEAIGRGKLKSKKELINEALNKRTTYGQALNRVIPDSILDSEFYSVLDLIERKVSGVRVKGLYPNQSIEIQRCGSGDNAVTKNSEDFNKPKDPLYLLDGIPVSPQLVNEMFGSEVLFIDVLKCGFEASQYGSRGGNGVIAVYTDRGENYEFVQEKKANIANFTIPGFYRAREFYSPSYSFEKPKIDKPDYRTTLYWSPNIKMLQEESANLSFYTGDTAGKYIIRIEGITDDGRPVHALHAINVAE